MARSGRATRAQPDRKAREEAERLNRLVGNLLDMTRIEAGALGSRARRRAGGIGAALEHG